jgi:hypothetical protein
MVPEPNDGPEPDDEPDDETDEEPDEEPDDEPDEDRDDEPEPGTLYFGKDDGWDGPDPAGAGHHAPAVKCPKTAPLGAVICWGVGSASLGKPLR